jgi:hypothetical protein
MGIWTMKPVHHPLPVAAHLLLQDKATVRDHCMEWSLSFVIEQSGLVSATCSFPAGYGGSDEAEVGRRDIPLHVREAGT